MKYGNNEVDIEICNGGFLGLIQSNNLMDAKPEHEVIMEALENPIGSQSIRELVKPGETVCIIISDTTSGIT